MASGGQMSDFVPGSSVKIHKFPCTPCSEDGKDIEAVNFCENCETHFCEPCVGLHNKLLKSHRLLDKAALKSGGGQKTKSSPLLLTEECKEHPGNIIQMYCGDHDIVCCTVCIALDHRECKGIDFIPKAATAYFKGQDKKGTTKISLDALCKEIEQLKAAKSKELLDLNNSERDILAEIQTTKEHILARVNELERRSIADVKAAFTDKVDLVKDELVQLDELIMETKNQVDSIKKIKSGNEAQLFVNIKQGKMVTEKTEKILSELNSIQRKISFVFEEELETAFKSIESFGSVSLHKKKYSASLISEHDCKQSDDKTTCVSFGTCVLDIGHILMTDYNNDQLKKFDQSFTETDRCSIVCPFSVCKIRSNEVAVSSLGNGQVCFVNMADKLTVKGTINVSRHCMGIAYSKGELFVACGSYNGKGNNAINVYNLKGSLIRSMKQTTYLANLSISPDGTTLHVACKDDGLVILDRAGNRLSLPSDTRLKSLNGVCQDDNENIYVCSENVNSILQIDRAGSVVSEMLTQSDGINQPLSVTIAKEPLRIMVTSRTKALQIFKLI